MSAESRLFQALEEMTREYSKNPSPALKNRIDYNREKYNRMRAKGGSKKDKLKIT
tara:strand:+ start:254 stop:418 length:165 start_codon:yes stop_codon:yes gene_type:complete